MIAIDSSSLIAFFADAPGEDVDMVDYAFEHQCAVLPPVVLSEMLSDHKLSPEVIKLLVKIPMLTVKTGFWERAGLSRAKIIKRGLRARLADTLIAQACIDEGVTLVARDADFRHFSKHCGLKLFRR